MQVRLTLLLLGFEGVGGRGLFSVHNDYRFSFNLHFVYYGHNRPASF